MEYGVLNSLYGQRAGVPYTKLPKALVNEESRSVHYWRDAIRRVPGRGVVLGQTIMPDANTAIHSHFHQSSGGLQYLFAFTVSHAYVWDNSNTEWDLMFTCSSPCDTWSTENFGQYVVATNNLDKVQYWNDATPATAFANLGGSNGIEYSTGIYLTRALVVKKHWNYLHLMSTYENGVEYKYFDRWCSAGDITDWDQGGLGDANYRQLSLNDEIIGSGVYNVQGANHLVVFSNRSVNVAWLTTDDGIYEAHDILSGTGLAAANSVVETPDGQVYYMSIHEASGSVEVRGVYSPNPISYDVQTIIDMINPRLLGNVVGAYIGTLRQIWWAIPSSSSSTGNDAVLSFNLETQTWNPLFDMDIRSFGFYKQQNTSYINDIDDMVNDMSNLIDSYSPVEGDPILLCSDYDGYIWSVASETTDKGSSYIGSLVISSDLGDGGLTNRHKRLHGLWLFFETTPGVNSTVTASIKKDDENTYTNIGTVSLNATGKIARSWLPYDDAFRDCHLKLAASNDFSFVGVIFDFDLTGKRL